MLNLLKILTQGFEWRSGRFNTTFRPPIDTTVPADEEGNIRYNGAGKVVEYWDGSNWVSPGGNSSSVDYDINF